MKGKTIAILEARVGEQMADLVRKYGGIPFSAPALAELPDIDPGHIAALLDDWTRQPPDWFIFQTGVGTKALLAATDALGQTGTLLGLLGASRVLVRGPKPTAVLRSRDVRIDRSAQDPYTTVQVLAELADEALSGKRVVVQRYGETNQTLDQALVARGASVVEIATYRWSLPADTGPLKALIGALARREIDAAAFTSASQVMNLMTVARESGAVESVVEDLNRILVASIGPVCSEALRARSIRVGIEAHPPKLGPFVTALNSYFAAV